MTLQLFSSYFPPKGNVAHERKKIQKFEYVDNEKSILDEMKSIFHNFFEGFL